MNELQNEKKPLCSRILDYFSNFKKLSKIMIIAGVVGLVVSVFLLVCFEISGGKNGNYFICAFGAYKKGSESNNILLGMFLFLAAVVSLVMSAIVAYQSIPYVFPKDKLNVRKSLPWCAFAGGVSQIVCAIFSILVLAIDTTVIAWAWVILAVVLILLGVVNILFAIPAARRELWMPKLGTEDEKE